MKKAIITIIIILVVLIGVILGLYFFTDVFNFLKPANETFAAQVQKLLGTEDSSYKKYESEIKGYNTEEKSYVSEGEIKVDLNIPTDALSKNVQDLINNSSIKLNESYDADKKTNYASMNLYKGNTKVLNIDLTNTEDSVSVTSKDFYNKSLKITPSEFSSFCSKNNIRMNSYYNNALSSIGDLRTSLFDFLGSADYKDTKQLYDLFYISEDDYNAIREKYDNFIEENIDKEHFSSSKNKKVSVNGEEIKTTAYTLKLSGKDTYKFLEKLLNSFKDDAIKNIIKEKYKYIAETNSDTDTEEISDSDIEDVIDSLLKNLEEIKDSDKYVKYTIYADKSNSPVRLEIEVLDDEDDKKGDVIFTEEIYKEKKIFTINCENLKDLGFIYDNENYNKTSSSSSKSKSIMNKISTTLSTIGNKLNSASEIVIEDNSEENNNSKKGTLTINVKSDSKESETIFTIDYEKISSSSEVKMYASLKSDVSEKFEITYNYDITDMDKDNVKVYFELSGKYEDYNVKATMTRNVKIGSTDIPEISEDNSVDILNLSISDLQTLLIDVVKNASNVLPDKLKNYNINITKEDILREFNIPADSTNTDITDTNAVTNEPAA